MTILADLILKIISSYIGFQKRLMRDKIVKRSFKFSQVLKIEHDSISHDFMRFEKVLFQDENFGFQIFHYRSFKVLNSWFFKNTRFFNFKSNFPSKKYHENSYVQPRWRSLSLKSDKSMVISNFKCRKYPISTWNRQKLSKFQKCKKS